MDLTRRDMFKLGALGAIGTAGASQLPWSSVIEAQVASLLAPSDTPRPFRTRFARPPVLPKDWSRRDQDGVWTDHFTVTERARRAQILPTLSTVIFGYNGSAPGPTIKVRQGRRAILTVKNELPEIHPSLGQKPSTSVHLHGSASLPQFDGYANDLTRRGFFKQYHYPNVQPARTLWYHDHGVHHTAQNAYAGLYAQYHMHDPEEQALLPQGEFDVPVTVADALFTANGALTIGENQSGLWGDVILVNGRPWPVMKVKRRIYRFRFLVASISRSYLFQLGNGDPVTVVGTDGGLMPKARQVDQWRQGSAERYEVLIDFRRYRPGQRVVLRNLSNANNVDFASTGQVMAFDVTDAPFSKRDNTWNKLPDTLVNSHVMRLRESDARVTRRIALARQGGIWTINGQTWHDVEDSLFQKVLANPRPNSTEIWELSNPGGGWFHPLHIHLVDFKILDRNGRPPFDFERGPKDVAYLGEGETVRVIIRFGRQRGRYMVHCHNLVHEDHDMMHQFAVGRSTGRRDPNDPMGTPAHRIRNP
jgi:FtsP/CotA-like multicopper oxidase with cupredoxin domain